MPVYAFSETRMRILVYYQHVVHIATAATMPVYAWSETRMLEPRPISQDFILWDSFGVYP